MVVLNLEVVDNYRSFKDLMLNFLYDNILSVVFYKNISCTKLDRLCPAPLWNIERMSRSCGYRLSTISYLDYLISFSLEGLYNTLTAAFTRFGVNGTFVRLLMTPD